MPVQLSAQRTGTELRQSHANTAGSASMSWEDTACVIYYNRTKKKTYLMLDIYTYSIKVTWLIDRITVIRIEGLELGSNETLTWKETGTFFYS